MIRTPRSFAALLSSQSWFDPKKTYELSGATFKEVDDADPSRKLSVVINRHGSETNFAGDAEVKALLKRTAAALERMSPAPNPNELTSVPGAMSERPRDAGEVPGMSLPVEKQQAKVEAPSGVKTLSAVGFRERG